MKGLKQFFSDFLSNQGLWVMISMFVSKLALFLTQLAVIRWLPKDEFGILVYFISIMTFFLPIVGAGTYQGLIRFGAILPTENQKFTLTNYALRYGFLGQIIITCIFIVVCVLLSNHTQSLFPILTFLSFRLFGFFIFNVIQAQFRAEHNNKAFAYSTLIFNVFALIITIFLTYFFQFYGYLIALGFAPFIILIFVRKEVLSFSKSLQTFDYKTFWKFNINASLALLIADFVFVLDIWLAEYFLNSETVAEYRVLAILPFNLLILPQIFLQTDYPKLCNKHSDKNYINHYIKNYHLLFSIIAIFTLIFSYLCKDFLIPFIFGNQYFGGNLFFILVFSVVFSWFSKTLYANLLVAIGKINWNLYIALFSVIILAISGYLLIPIFQFAGLVYSVCISLIISSILFVLMFYILYPKVLKNE